MKFCVNVAETNIGQHKKFGPGPGSKKAAHDKKQP